ncbi:HAD family hydrolase [Candidatus Woesearchaeota archaeon]|nr:HAD family hydrolase [Candidatus Woesearchaeota archaeon]
MTAETIFGREYRHFPSPLSEGMISLPYSGEHSSPVYHPRSEIVHAYDLGGTLASAVDRDEVIRKLTRESDIRSKLFIDVDFTKKVSQAQEQGIRIGEISIAALNGVVKQLQFEASAGEEAVMITVGTYQMARSFIHGAGLEGYVSALLTSEETGTGNKKTTDILVRAYEAIRARGARIVDYCDDNVNDIMAAVDASKEIEKRYGYGFEVYLIADNDVITNDTQGLQLGRTEQGFSVIRSILEKEKS